MLGDSITDGRAPLQTRITAGDILANRLRADSDTAIAVLNHGVAVTQQWQRWALYSSFERDALDQPGVRWLLFWKV